MRTDEKGQLGRMEKLKDPIQTSSKQDKDVNQTDLVSKQKADLCMFPLGKSGLSIPALGFGIGTSWYQTKTLTKGRLLSTCIRQALDVGFTHIDEAEMYENAKWLNTALSKWYADDREHHTREKLFITGKVMKVDKGVEKVCRNSLKKSGLEYYDLFLIHAPFKKNAMPFKTPLSEVWAQMEDLVRKGLTKSIGVSNFRIQDMEEVLENCSIRPSCNQIECHPYLQQNELRSYCKKEGILVAAFGSLVPVTKLKHGPVDRVLKRLSEKTGKTPVQILMRWNLQIGNVVVSTTSKLNRMKDYVDVLNFQLTEGDMEKITEAGKARKEKRTFWSNKNLDKLWASTVKTSVFFMRKFYLRLPKVLNLKNYPEK
mmetsp:Transcript_5680/g.7451  ORF Transcript_5680/g.7451 Transcript_5680/m.7451 type:complete len:370 (+) Transcript_5680:210-1319(+)